MTWGITGPPKKCTCFKYIKKKLRFITTMSYDLNWLLHKEAAN